MNDECTPSAWLTLQAVQVHAWPCMDACAYCGYWPYSRSSVRHPGSPTTLIHSQACAAHANAALCCGAPPPLPMCAAWQDAWSVRDFRALLDTLSAQEVHAARHPRQDESVLHALCMPAGVLRWRRQHQADAGSAEPGACTQAEEEQRVIDLMQARYGQLRTPPTHTHATYTQAATASQFPFNSLLPPFRSPLLALASGGKGARGTRELAAAAGQPQRRHAAR